VDGLSDAAVAQLARTRGIDIGVDLNGYTRNARPGIFAQRPAPVQVSFLGYPGTTAQPFMDYLVADPWVVPASEAEHYSEALIWLPNSYQVNDPQRRIAAEPTRRHEHGLVEGAFVFCCFNQTYKILPETFGLWMRILSQVDGSVLWLLHCGTEAAQNLRRAAEGSGVAPCRLVFAPKIEESRHLARLRLADLCLDTLPCNAHTTASDALFSGVPVLTRVGRSFAARVAASLLDAVGLPHLITRSAEEYVERAIELARDPSRLARLRTWLDRESRHQPLFDLPRYARHLESAYLTCVECAARGDAPRSFSVPKWGS
jgi:predicted O-linked N-acetylglucosamine transferase (SPINDLY family)